MCSVPGKRSCVDWTACHCRSCGRDLRTAAPVRHSLLLLSPLISAAVCVVNRMCSSVNSWHMRCSAYHVIVPVYARWTLPQQACICGCDSAEQVWVDRVGHLARGTEQCTRHPHADWTGKGTPRPHCICTQSQQLCKVRFDIRTIRIYGILPLTRYTNTDICLNQ